MIKGIVKHKKNDLLSLNTIEIEEMVLTILGIKTVVKKENEKLYIQLQSYQSCFKLMERLHFDFDFSVHKRNRIYIIEI
jgi:adenylate cyclase class IV